MKTKGRANKKKRRERKDGCIWDHPHRHSLLFLIRPGGRAQSKLKAQALADLKAHHLEDALARDGLDQEDAVVTMGRRFRDTVLSWGGSRSPAEVFEAFRGRQPSSEALIRHSGLAVA